MHYSIGKGFFKSFVIFLLFSCPLNAVDMTFIHPKWQDEMVYQDKKTLCRLSGDCANISFQSDSKICIRWFKYGIECFLKQSENEYRFQEEDVDLFIESHLAEAYSQQEYTLQHPFIQKDPYNRSPLTALMMFSTDKPAEITILIHGIRKNDDIIHTFSGFEKEHKIPILGLYPNFQNKVTVIAKYQDGKQEISHQVIQTGYVEILGNFTVVHKADNKPYLYHLIGVHSYIFDENGYARFVFKGDQEKGFIFYFKDVIAQDNSDKGLVLYNHLGKKLKTLFYPKGFSSYNHGVYRKDNGNFWIIGSFAGTSHQTSKGNIKTYADHFIELDKETGQLVQIFDLADYLNINREIVLKTSQNKLVDWAHINSVVSSLGKVFVSVKHVGILQIDYQTKELDWIITWPKDCSVSGRNNQGAGFCDKLLSPQKSGTLFSDKVIKGYEIAKDWHYPMANHDFKVYKKGLFSVFSNNGRLADSSFATKDNSDVLLFTINQDKKTVQPVKWLNLPIYAPIGSSVTLNSTTNEVVVFGTQVADKNTGKPLNYLYRYSLKDGRRLFEAITTSVYSVFPYFYKAEPVDLYEGYIYLSPK